MPAVLRVVVAAFVLLASAGAQEPTGEYLSGYAAAVLEREFQVRSARIVAVDGVLSIHSADLGDIDRDRVRRALQGIPGVVAVEFREDAAEAAPPLPTAEKRFFLSRSPLLFEPLHADPRWPHLSLAYHDYRGDDGLDSVAAASLGESFSLVRRGTEQTNRWEIGLQAGVFSIFDLDSDSFDLVNADYFVGPAFVFRRDRFSAMARVYHQSSHLGDEYLLRAQPERINLSYEVLDVLASYDVSDSLRVYAGGGYVLHSYTPLEPWLAQAGAEWFGEPFGGSGIRPLLACDVQLREENDWRGDVSARVGIELADPEATEGRMQILLEYYRGRSPNGQFFEQDIELLGIGLHFYF